MSMPEKSPLAFAVAVLALLVPLCLQAQDSDQGWKFSVLPYLWLPTLSGDLNYTPPSGGSAPRVSIDPGDYLDNLDMALMVVGTARKGRWVVGTDVIYLDFSGTNSSVKSVDFDLGAGPVNVSAAEFDGSADSSVQGWVWTLAGGYTVVQEPKLSLDVLAGFRYLTLKARTDWNLDDTVTGTGPDGRTATFSRKGTVKQSEDIWTGIAGIRGRYRLGTGGWFANFYADVGGGSDTFTWQGNAGIGHEFGWGDVQVDYRYLYYSQSGDKLFDSLSMGGLALGANFRF